MKPRNKGERFSEAFVLFYFSKNQMEKIYSFLQIKQKPIFMMLEQLIFSSLQQHQIPLLLRIVRLNPIVIGLGLHCLDQ